MPKVFRVCPLNLGDGRIEIRGLLYDRATYVHKVPKVLKILLVPARASRTLPGAARAGNWDTPHPPNRRRAVASEQNAS